MGIGNYLIFGSGRKDHNVLRGGIMRMTVRSMVRIESCSVRIFLRAAVCN
jgi:hypothetical protein